MEIKNKLGDKVPTGEMLKEVMGGDTMEFYSITLSYIGQNGVMQSQTFRKATTEELEE
jgi:hypothetical protein